LGKFPISGRDLILLAGGLFLLYKSTHEIHDKLEGKEEEQKGKKAATLAGVVLQIGILDIIFSLDSVITAVGMANELAIMITAVIVAVGIMMFASDPISKFVNHHPTIKILALSFLLLIGMSLIVEALHQEIPKGYIYFAMGFSVFVEMLNLRMRTKVEPVKLHQAYVPVEATAVPPLPQQATVAVPESVSPRAVSHRKATPTNKKKSPAAKNSSGTKKRKKE
jgi:predicted tellurium resistance membrane protein TerC